MHFAQLQTDRSIKYKNTLFGNYFLKCNKVKIILISFNCFFSENIKPLLFEAAALTLSFIWEVYLCAYFTRVWKRDVFSWPWEW